MQKQHTRTHCINPIVTSSSVVVGRFSPVACLLARRGVGWPLSLEPEWGLVAFSLVEPCRPMTITRAIVPERLPNRCLLLPWPSSRPFSRLDRLVSPRSHAGVLLATQLTPTPQDRHTFFFPEDAGADLLLLVDWGRVAGSSSSSSSPFLLCPVNGSSSRSRVSLLSRLSKAFCAFNATV